MSSSDRPPNPRWLTIAFAGTGLLWVVAVTTYAVLGLTGTPVKPNPINILIVVGIATITLGLILVRIDRRMDGLLAGQERHDRRLAEQHSALVRQSAHLVEATGDIPRIVLPPVRGVATVMPAMEPPVAELLPSPATVAAMHRLARKVTDV